MGHHAVLLHVIEASFDTGDDLHFAGQVGGNGFANSFFGAGAGLNNNGNGGLFLGTQNSFLGRHAGFANTTGYDNVFIGANTATANAAGFRNTVIGTFSWIIAWVLGRVLWRRIFLFRWHFLNACPSHFAIVWIGRLSIVFRYNFLYLLFCSSNKRRAS